MKIAYYYISMYVPVLCHSYAIDVCSCVNSVGVHMYHKASLSDTVPVQCIVLVRVYLLCSKFCDIIPYFFHVFQFVRNAHLSKVGPVHFPDTIEYQR